MLPRFGFGNRAPDPEYSESVFMSLMLFKHTTCPVGDAPREHMTSHSYEPDFTLLWVCHQENCGFRSGHEIA